MDSEAGAAFLIRRVVTEMKGGERKKRSREESGLFIYLLIYLALSSFNSLNHYVTMNKHNAQKGNENPPLSYVGTDAPRMLVILMKKGKTGAQTRS